MKLLDVTQKGNLCRFYIGSNWLKHWSGVGWRAVSYNPDEINKIELVNKKYIHAYCDFCLPYDIDIRFLFPSDQVEHKMDFVKKQVPFIQIYNPISRHYYELYLGMPVANLFKIMNSVKGYRMLKYQYPNKEVPDPQSRERRQSWYQRMKSDPEKFEQWLTYQREWQRKKREEEKRKKMEQRRKDYVLGIGN